MFEQYIDNVVLNSGQKVFFPKSSLIILTGANNSGKTTTLEELYDGMARDYSESKIIKHCEVNGTDDRDEAIKWLNNNYYFTDSNGQRTWHSFKTGISHIKYFDFREKEQMKDFFGLYLNTKNRLEIGSTKESIDLFRRHPEEFIHILQLDETKLKSINKEINSIFNRNLIINWGGANNVWFNVGREPKRTSLNDRVSKSYLDIINRYPKLEEEGDGIRSYVGVLMSLFCAPNPILLIDEPEAFLHPFQSKKLGEKLALSFKKQKRQIFIATHSSDIIEGAMATGAPICIVRIDRMDNSNIFNLLENDQIKMKWTRPILKTSGVLNGFFYNGVVICEGDSDCKFYESILKKVQSNKSFSKIPDLYFTHGNGKGKIPHLMESYKLLNIRTAAIMDIDVLKNKREFKNIYNSTLNDSTSNDFNEIEVEYESVRTILEKIPPIKNINQFIVEMKKIIDNIQKKNKITNKDKENISLLLNESSDWSEIKKNGIKSISTSERKTVKKFFRKMQKVGLFILPIGELERWYDNGLNKENDKWISKMLADLRIISFHVNEAEEYMINVLKYFNISVIEKTEVEE